MKHDNPFAKLGALDQKLYQETTPRPPDNIADKAGNAANRQTQNRKSPSRVASSDFSSPPTISKPTKQEEKKTHNASVLAGKPDSLQAGSHASVLALTTDTLETIRKIVKNPGKEDVLYVRLSKEEKDKLADVSYTYKRQGIRTSDNELVRVAINTLLEDYKSNGANSLLAIIIASLHA